MDLSPPLYNAGQARIGVDADGDAVAAWRSSEGDGSIFLEYSFIEARPISSTGVLGDPVDLSSGGDHRERATFPDLAIDADGDALVFWARPRGDADHRSVNIYGRRISVDGALGSLLFGRTVSYTTPSIPHPGAGIDAGGQGLVVWSSNHERMGDRVYALDFSASDVRGIEQGVSGKGQALNFQLGMGAGGNAVVAWEHSDGVNSRIEISRGP
jgi:hypothetical protein